jgi:hypothetical protein
VESFQINGRLRRPDGIAVVGVALGQLLMDVGQPDQARDVLSDSLAATKIGWTAAVLFRHAARDRSRSVAVIPHLPRPGHQHEGSAKDVLLATR